MKKLLVLFIPLISFICANSQSLEGKSYQNGYIGISFGPSFPVGNFGSDVKNYDPDDETMNGFAKAGINVSLMDLAYYFYENYGLQVSMKYSAYENREYDYDSDYWYNTAYLAGPVIFIPIEQNLGLELKPKAGFAKTTKKDEAFSESGFAMDIGTFIRYDYSDKWRMYGGANFFYSEPDTPPESKKLTVTTLTLAIGLGYKFDL